jgi:hypothetical protein
MNKPNAAIASFIVLGLLGLYGPAYSQNDRLNTFQAGNNNQGGSKTVIKFEISPHFMREEGGAYHEGGPISIRSVFVNAGAKQQSIVLSDHDDYSGTLPFPVGVRAKVWDSLGKVLTENDNSDEGWWTSYYLSASTYEEKPGDKILLKPGEKVVRIIPLDIMLRGCKGFPNGVLSGRYTVQLSIEGITSNKTEIMIKR